MTSLEALVDEIAKLSLQRYPDLPRSMYIARHEPVKLRTIVGFELPEGLKALYCTTKFMSEPWQGIMFYSPNEIGERSAHYNDHDRHESPPLRVGPGVKMSVTMGEPLIPVANFDDSLFCVDMDPDVSTGGVAEQIVNVSIRKGTATVVFPNVEAFLQDGLKKINREMKREEQERAKRAASRAVTPEQGAHDTAMLRSLVTHSLKSLVSLPFGSLFARTRTVAEPAPRIDPADPSERVSTLLASNPQRTPLQCVCAELIEAYGANAELSVYLDESLPPMSQASRQGVEHALGVTLPGDLQELLDAHRRVGVSWDNIVAIGVDDGVVKRCKELARIKMPADSWGLWPGTTVPVFGKGLLPIGGDGDPVICYDLAPGEGGAVGQLIEVDFESATCKVVAGSLLEFFSQGLENLKAGPA